MRLIVLGCGALGTAVGLQWMAAGGSVIGVRRSEPIAAPFTILNGDVSDPALFECLPSDVDAIFLAATPGLRRGRDNGLAEGAQLVAQRYPRARFVYSGTTAVYADADGAGVDERGICAVDEASRGLLAIEQAVLTQGKALVLRVSGLVGPGRTYARERLAEALKISQPCVVRGDPDRPFSYCHETDCAEICLTALRGSYGCGVLNVAAPDRLTVRDYYLRLVGVGRSEVVRPVIQGDGSQAPARWIDASRLWGMEPHRRWRGVDAAS